MAPTPAAAPRRLLRAFSLAPRLPSQPGTDPDSPASSPEIELDLLGPQGYGGDGAAPADHQPAPCQQISVRRRVTQLPTTTAAALESPASTPSSSPTTEPTLPLPWPSPSLSLGHLRRHSRNGSVTSLVSDASSLSTAFSETGSSPNLRQNRRRKSQREAEAESVWRDFWS